MNETLTKVTDDRSQVNAWKSDAHARRRRFRWLIAGSHHVTWFLGKKFPKAFPYLFVLGFPKSGTSWVCQLLGDYFRLPFPQHSLLPIGAEAVVHGHETWAPNYPRCVYALRDGRDAMVSLYFHALSQRDKAKGAVAARLADKGAVAESFGEFLERQLRRPDITDCTWGKHVDSLKKKGAKPPIVLRYEDLLAAGEAALARCVEQLTGTPADLERARQAIERYAFQKQAGNRKAGQEDSSSYLRKGTRGDWRNHFTPELARRFHEVCGQALIDAGYEKDGSWVAESTQRAAA